MNLTQENLFPKKHMSLVFFIREISEYNRRIKSEIIEFSANENTNFVSFSKLNVHVYSPTMKLFFMIYFRLLIGKTKDFE